MADLIEIAALWESTDKNGNPMLTGKMGNARVVVLKNTYKDKENQPDYRVYVTKNERREDTDNNQPAEDMDSIPF